MRAPSYVQGVSRQPLLGDTVGSLLDRISAAHPERRTDGPTA